MFGHLGFSYVGFTFLMALVIPNIVWAKWYPVEYNSSAESKILLVFERVGQALCFVSLLIFSDTNLKGLSLWSLWLLASALLMVIYECYWFRYFRSERKTRDFYRPLLGVPIPGVILPVAAILLLGVYGRLIWLFAAAVIFGIGHIGIHWRHSRFREEATNSFV